MVSTFSEVALDSVDERGLGAGDDEVNAEFDGEVYQLVELADVNGDIVDFGDSGGGASVSFTQNSVSGIDSRRANKRVGLTGSNVDLLHLSTLGKLPSKRMFSTSGPNNEDLHGELRTFWRKVR